MGMMGIEWMERTSYWNECMDVRCLAKRINNAEKMHV
jgi:hypothetical protein